MDILSINERACCLYMSNVNYIGPFLLLSRATSCTLFYTRLLVRNNVQWHRNKEVGMHNDKQAHIIECNVLR
jgi:hypothetical protein